MTPTVNYTTIAAELRTCPGDCLGLFRWVPSQETYELFVAFRSGSDMRIADALSEAIEFCERMAAIDGCWQHNTYGTHGQSGLVRMDGDPCAKCPAEYHGGQWV
jgi:hypothetical protein